MKKRNLGLAGWCLVAGVGLSWAEDPKPAAEPFSLTTPAFAEGTEIPLKYTCAGGDVNPQLDIKNVPPNTKSLALTVHDPDAPEGEWVHWVLYNIPPDKTSIAENTTAGEQALTDFGKYAYAGPCPTNEKMHRYVFRAYALSTKLELNEGITKKDLEKAMRGHIIASSTLTGTYTKPGW